MVAKQISNRVLSIPVDFKGSHYPKCAMLYAVSYRGLNEIRAGRGVNVDHAKLNHYTAAARRFVKCVVDCNGILERIAVDQNRANLVGRQSFNVIRKFTSVGRSTDYRFIKRLTHPVLGFNLFHSAVATLVGIETAHMACKGQLNQTGSSVFKQFATN